MSGAMTADRALPRSRPLEPVQQLVRVADRGGQPDALDRVASQFLQSFQDGEKVPAAVVTSEGMDLVDHDRANVGEVLTRVDLGGDEHRFEGLGGRKQHVGRVGEDRFALPLCGVAMPKLRSATQPIRVGVESGFEVVQQRPQRADVQHRQSAPSFVRSPGEYRETRRLGLAPGRRREQKGVIPTKDGCNGRLLKRPKARPPESVDDVVEDRRVKGAVAHSSMSSGLVTPAAALRSTSLSSPLLTVSL